MLMIGLQIQIGTEIRGSGDEEVEREERARGGGLGLDWR